MIIDFYQSEHFAAYRSRAYNWVRLMLVSRIWRTTILSFPSLWSKLVMSTSVSRSRVLTLVERSGSHPLQVVIPPPPRSDAPPKSIRYKHIDLVAELLPRISQLVIASRGGHDTAYIYRVFRDRTADRLRRLDFIALPQVDNLFVLYAPRLVSLYLSGVESWPAPIAENLTHIHLDFHLNRTTLERDLKNSPRLKEIRINGVHPPPERFGTRSRISLIPGVRLVITGSHNTVASLFALGSTNYLSITTNVIFINFPTTSFLKFALPQDISHFRNLNDLTKVHLELVDSAGNPRTRAPRTVTMILMCSTAERETLHLKLEYILSNPRPSTTKETKIIPERPPAMRALNYLRPLDMSKVLELRMVGFVGEWGLQSFELYQFLLHMPALRRIRTGDDNKETFLFALSSMSHGAAVVIEAV